MGLNEILTIVLGTSGMLFVYWFFFMKKEDAVKVADEIEILVSGGYKPSVIEVKSNKNTKISFLRKDSSACLEEIVLSEFKIKKFLPLNEKVTIEIFPKTKGEFAFSCGMNMYHGKIIVS